MEKGMEREMEYKVKTERQAKRLCNNSQEERWCDSLDYDSSNRNEKSE